jgi:hypothetical protein
MKNREQYEFIYENNAVDVALAVVTIVPTLYLFGYLCALSTFQWISLLLLPIISFPWILRHFFPQIYTYKGYAVITEEGIDIQLRFSKCTLMWAEIEHIWFKPPVHDIYGRRRGLHFNLAGLINYRKISHIKLSRTDKDKSLYRFYQAVQEYYYEQLHRHAQEM